MISTPDTLLALSGDLGTNVPCHLFHGIVRTSLPVNGKHRRIRLRPPLDTIKIQSFDGTWAVVDVQERQGPQATLRLHRIHMNILGLDKALVHKELIPTTPNKNKEVDLHLFLELLL